MKFSRILLLSASLLSFQAHAMDMPDEERPDEHRCPISFNVMQDPVVAADGRSYERESILKWLNAGNVTSPMTLLPLKNKDLFDNQALKTTINEWKPGRQRMPSVLEQKKAADIVQRVKEEFSKNAALLNAAKGQHIVAFLGNTGAGKSTLVNLLAGKELKVSEDGLEYILADPSDDTAMVIGAGGSSETIYPKFIDVEGLRFFDLPGFNDTDGSERNLINAAFTRQILLDAASVRLVFVAGQDQFTADRGDSVKKMSHATKTLFVVDQDINLIDDGVFVATKVIGNEYTDMLEFLSKKTDSRDKAELNAQLKSWSQSNRLCRMFHPVRDIHNTGARDHILESIKNAKPVKIHGINVSVLYPPDTKGPLERMFSSVLEGAFERKINTPHTTLSDYDQAITSYMSDSFWQTFDQDVCREKEAIGLLKDFCLNPYTNALRVFEKDNEKKRQSHIQALKHQRHQRVEDIEKRTETRAKKVIKPLVPQKRSGDFVSFDFAYHKDFYDQVCGTGAIEELATDILEQDIARRYYAGFMSEHSHNQMMRWHQQFGGAEALALAQQEIKDLKQQLEPLIKDREAKAERREQRRIQAQKAAEQERIRVQQAAVTEQQRMQAQRAAEQERIRVQQAAEAEQRRLQEQERIRAQQAAEAERQIMSHSEYCAASPSSTKRHHNGHRYIGTDVISSYCLYCGKTTRNY